MSDSVYFKTLLNEPATSFTSSSISGFGFNTDNSHFQAVFYNSGMENESVKKFAKVIMLGYTSLYLLETAAYEESSQPDLFRVAVFVAKKADLFYTLRQVAPAQDFNGPPQKEYLSQLQQIMADCEAISGKEIKSVNFSIKAITALFRKYNNCKNGVAAVEYKTASRWTLAHELAAAYLTTAATSQDGAGSGFSAAYAINFFKKGKAPKQSLSMGLMYRRSSFVFVYSSFALSVRTDASQNIISIPFNYRYYFQDKNKGLFIGAGIALGYSMVDATDKAALKVLDNTIEIMPGVNAGYNFNKRLGLLLFADRSGMLKSKGNGRFFAGLGLGVQLN